MALRVNILQIQNNDIRNTHAQAAQKWTVQLPQWRNVGTDEEPTWVDSGSTPTITVSDTPGTGNVTPHKTAGEGATDDEIDEISAYNEEVDEAASDLHGVLYSALMDMPAVLFAQFQEAMNQAVLDRS